MQFISIPIDKIVNDNESILKSLSVDVLTFEKDFNVRYITWMYFILL